MWGEFVVGSRPCFKTFFCEYSCFSLSSKTNISNFQFDLDYCQVLSHELLAQEIVQALPVLLTLNKLLYSIALKTKIDNLLVTSFFDEQVLKSQ